MALRKILNKTDPSLRKKSRPVEKFDARLWQILDDMKDTLQAANGIGLAAPQIGVLRRVMIIDFGEGLTEYVNPSIIFAEDEQEGREGCLSIPGEWGMVNRPHHVKIKAQDRFGRYFLRQGYDLEAVCMCHEADHLDGVLYTDKATRMIDPDEDEDDDFDEME